MKTIGLTGGIGMGKSTTARLLRERGVAVVDTDDLARDVVRPGESALEELRKVFGAGIVDAAGQLRREALAQVVFADNEARQKLEAILHPRIRDLWRAQVASWRAEACPLAVVVIPLLYETKAETDFAAVICTACAAGTQRERLRARGWSDVEITGRLAAQMSPNEKMHRANFVIWTEGEMGVHAAQLERILGLI